MDIYLSNLVIETKYTNKERIRIFIELLMADLTDTKIAKIIIPYFKMSTTRENDSK
jgi:hypothetical protein